MTISNLSHPLFAIKRSISTEIVVHGAVCIKFQDKAVKSTSSFSFLSKSLLNPWQFLAAEVAGSEDFWSIGLSFHSGQEPHMDALSSLAKIAKAGEDELFCPREYPLDWERAAKMRFANERPRRICHPSSGKHLLLLAACEKYGYTKADYWEQSHPIQKKLFSLVGKEAKEPIKWAYDNCGAPTFYLSERANAVMWEKLALDETEQVVKLKNLWFRNPRLIGGWGRLDSDLCIAARNKAFIKEGSDGLLMVQSLPSAGEPAASCLIKIASGYHKNYLGLALLCAIKANPELPSVFHELKEYLQSRLDDLMPGKISSLLELPL